MDQNEAAQLNPEQVPAPETYEDLAGRLETMLLAPLATDDEAARVCREAAGLGLASVFVRPGDLELAVTQVRGSSTAAGSICGYPHGWSTTAAKLYELRDMLRRGAKEVMAVAPVGRLVSRQFQAVETEVLQMARACREEGARFRLILDQTLLAEDLRVIGMKIAKRSEADFVQMSLEPSETVLEQAAAYKKVLKWFCGLAAPCPADTLEAALKLYALDAARIQCASPAAVLREWKQALALKKAQSAAVHPSE